MPSPTPPPEDTDRKPATTTVAEDDVDDEDAEAEAEAEDADADASASADAAIQDRADLLREALSYEAVGRLMARTIVGFLTPTQKATPGESYAVPDPVEPDEITEAARNAARRAAYSRLIRIFESDLPDEGDGPHEGDNNPHEGDNNPHEAIVRAQLESFGCDTGEGG